MALDYECPVHHCELKHLWSDNILDSCFKNLIELNPDVESILGGEVHYFHCPMLNCDFVDVHSLTGVGITLSKMVYTWSDKFRRAVEYHILMIFLRQKSFFEKFRTHFVSDGK